MRASWCNFALLMLLLTSASLRADHPAGPRTAAARGWLDQLGDRSFRVRERAGSALLAMGPAVLPELRKRRDDTDPEVRRRLDQIISHLEKAETLAPQRISLRLNQEPLDAVLAALTHESGYRFELGESKDEESSLFSFHISDAPFWQTLDRVNAAAGVALLCIDNNGLIHLGPQEHVSPYVAYAGPFRVVADSVQDMRVLDLTQHEERSRRNEQTLSLSITVFSEPRLPIVDIGQIQVLEATDDQGRCMVRPHEGEVVHQFSASPGGLPVRQYSLQSELHLSRPSKNSLRIERLRASIPVTVLASQRAESSVEQVLMAKGKTLQLGRFPLQVDDVVRTADPGPAGYCVQLVGQSSAEQREELETELSRENWQRIGLEDSKGRCYQLRESSCSAEGATGIRARLIFGEPADGPIGPPARLVAYRWTKYEHVVTVEFRDIPLP